MAVAAVTAVVEEARRQADIASPPPGAAAPRPRRLAWAQSQTIHQLGPNPPSARPFSRSAHWHGAGNRRRKKKNRCGQTAKSSGPSTDRNGAGRRDVAAVCVTGVRPGRAAAGAAAGPPSGGGSVHRHGRQRLWRRRYGCAADRSPEPDLPARRTPSLFL
jgi:hypothetical protein